MERISANIIILELHVSLQSFKIFMVNTQMYIEIVDHKTQISNDLHFFVVRSLHIYGPGLLQSARFYDAMQNTGNNPPLSRS